MAPFFFVGIVHFFLLSKKKRTKEKGSRDKDDLLMTINNNWVFQNGHLFNIISLLK